MRNISFHICRLFFDFFSLSLGVNEPLNYAVEAVQKFKQGYLKLTAVQKEKTSLGKKNCIQFDTFLMSS